MMPDAARGPLLRMRNVGKSFRLPWGTLMVLSDVTIDVQPGEFVVVTGPSGSGKTTLLHLAGLLDDPTSGRVEFLGADPSRMKDRDLRRLRATQVGLVFQSFHLLPRRTVLDNVRLRFRYLETPSREAEARCRAALDRVGLADRAAQPVRWLSGGEMQRVAIARAIALPPSLLLVDEPTGNLDADSAQTVMDHLQTLNRDGMTIILATHNPAWLRYGSRHWQCLHGAVRDGSPPSLQGGAP